MEELSDDAILASNHLPWICDALVRLKAKRRHIRLQQSTDEWAIDGVVADPIGVTRQWQGSEAYIRVGRTELLITPGQLIWLDRTGIWIDTIHTTHIDPKLKTHTVLRGSMTRSAYNIAIRTKSQQAHVSPTERPAFEIWRPV
jgi:hypothetical protein